MNIFFRAPVLRAAAVAVLAAAGSFASLGPAQGSTGAAVTYRGPGFDGCTVPSVAQLTRMKPGPDHALAVYIGGVNAGCPARLSSSWVRGATVAGWSVIPTYVGLQAPLPRCACRGTSRSGAFSNGLLAAADAARIMTTIGIPRGNPVYDDMEGYTRGGSNTPAVLAFLAGWTEGLHERGYRAGVYSSASSGIADLVNEAEHLHSSPLPDDIWIADWNGSRTVSDPWVPAALWSNHQRIHQYNGGMSVRYGGVSLYVDGDWLDGGVVSAASL
jgi:hypothetical protein